MPPVDMTSKTGQVEPWFLTSHFPVSFPAHAGASNFTNIQFEEYLRQELEKHGSRGIGKPLARDAVGLDEMDIEPTCADTPADIEHPFMKGLLSRQQKDDNRMLTENGDVAYRSTKNALADLFAELEDTVSGQRLNQLLDAAWAQDSTMTLKIIFNARSIHLGKSSRQTFYRCAGWLAKHHPLTLVMNLEWLSRPVIQKRAEKDDTKKADEEDMVFVEGEMDENGPTRFDVRNGVAHGYWKDLLNVLALHVNGKLDVLANPRDILNVEQEREKTSARDRRKSKRDTTRSISTEDRVMSAKRSARELRHQKRDGRHLQAVSAFKTDPVYRALHLTVARLFAAQLKADLALLRGDDAKAKRSISLCAKWAPSNERFHDKHTFIVSTIAEIMYPAGSLNMPDNNSDSAVDQRETYLRYARNAYRMNVAALRKHLEVVEREIAAKTFENIKYDRVPSIAMNNYAPLFAKKDTERFEVYLDKVASGEARISGATLLPSTLIHSVAAMSGDALDRSGKPLKGTKKLIQAKVIDGQWNALVQRIRDSGTLDNCIAVADVSGSMSYPDFSDGTTPMDSSIGLSLLIAEVTRPPFGGAFITFSHDPTVQAIDLSMTLQQKYKQLARSDWGANTDFVAVFENLILPVAVKNKLKPEDMVKRIFAFSDMQFDQASCGNNRWTTSYERIKEQFLHAGYEMPELVFWNLAAGAHSLFDRLMNTVTPVAAKPVTAGEPGTAIVSGYSQGLLKVFLDNGQFEDPDAEEEVVEKKGDDDDTVVVEKAMKKPTLDPLSIVKKAVSHKAYAMLRVVD